MLWFFFCSIQSLDRGGAITGRPSQKQQQQRRVDSPVPSSDTVSGDTDGTSIKKKILNSLNVGYAITGPPTVQPSSRYIVF